METSAVSSILRIDSEINRKRKYVDTTKFSTLAESRTTGTLQIVARSYHVEADCDKEHMLPGILGEKSDRRIIEIQQRGKLVLLRRKHPSV